jgi:uncharacterized protein YdhG (YjbR/CyaY superfamily)
MTSKKQVTTIDEYIGTFPAEIRAILERVRQTIHEAAPEAIETISYGIPAFDLNSQHLVWFAAWKHHISLYPIPAGDGAFRQKLSRYKKAKGTIQFPRAKPIPYDLIGEVVALLKKQKPKKSKR